jgi:hypothetical protein
MYNNASVGDVAVTERHPEPLQRQSGNVGLFGRHNGAYYTGHIRFVSAWLIFVKQLWRRQGETGLADDERL